MEFRSEVAEIGLFGIDAVDAIGAVPERVFGCQAKLNAGVSYNLGELRSNQQGIGVEFLEVEVHLLEGFQNGLARNVLRSVLVHHMKHYRNNEHFIVVGSVQSVVQKFDAFIRDAGKANGNFIVVGFCAAPIGVLGERAAQPGKQSKSK